MTLTVGEAFDLLFAPGNLSSSPICSNAAFEGRRWFRKAIRQENFELSADDIAELERADKLLCEKVNSRSLAWTSSLGSNDTLPARASFDSLRHLPPRTPYDVFAAAAYLIESAGVYHHLQPSKLGSGSHGVPDTASSVRHIAITAEDRGQVRAAAKAWRSLARKGRLPSEFAAALVADDVWKKIEPMFESWFVVFGYCAQHPVFDRITDGREDSVPAWWKHAWRLFAIADETAKGTGFQFDFSQGRKAAEGKKSDICWFELDVMVEHLMQAVSDTPDTDSSPAYGELADITSLSIAREAVACVLPKVRTPAVGCTLRSLSHHLALLPAAGVARGRWTPNYIKQKPKAGSMPEGVMNLLLVPLPYSLRANSFQAALVEDVRTGKDRGTPRFGYFDVDQHWITEDAARPAAIVTFVQALIKTAQKQCPAVHGLVFPELSLDYNTFRLVREHIRQHLPEADILISGTSSNEAGVRGNYVAVASFQKWLTSGAREYRETVREKHHRWKLERQQLQDYGLLGVLSPELSWWENIALQNRRVDFTVMHRDSVLAAMICEDLARVDPCQKVIRAVGPNLVVALLMDAPQLSGRWPARYATVLAEDPGCAVLTLTSRGLMTRQHRLGIFPSDGKDRIVALWRDDRNQAPVQLKCPYDSQGVLLTIVEEGAEDISLDGRADRDAKAWRYAGDVPVRIPSAKARYAHILGEEDNACW
jgi:hypothetical protein